MDKIWLLLTTCLTHVDHEPELPKNKFSLRFPWWKPSLENTGETGPLMCNGGQSTPGGDPPGKVGPFQSDEDSNGLKVHQVCTGDLSGDIQTRKQEITPVFPNLKCCPVEERFTVLKRKTRTG